MDFNLFLGLFSTLGLGYMYIGYQAAQNVKTLDDYFLAGRQLGLFALTIALIATQLGGGIILGTSKEAYSHGIYGIMYVVGISIGFLILASGFAAHLRRFNVNTTAELFQTEFKSEHLKKIASLLSMLSLCGILLAQVVASRNLMLSLNVYSETIFILFWLFVIGYTMLGGLRAIVNNDIFQLAFIIAVFCSIFAYELIGNPGGVITTLTSTPLFDFSSFFSWSRLLAIVIIPACYSLIEQDIAQTLFAARSPKIALLGTFIASIFMLCFALIPVYFGIQAQRLGLIIPEGANPLISLFDQTYSPALVTLVVYGVFAAIISTADALLCAISSHLVQDFNLTAHSKHALTISKSVTFSIGIAALVQSENSKQE
ncbi:MAG: hypothetical protein M1114_03875 [Candidatus Dependentiae bacterium]|nr:hypothetical protein [Candidatus Dependentiae bacterium]